MCRYFLAQSQSPAHLKYASPLGSLSASNRIRWKTKEHLVTYHWSEGLKSYLSVCALSWFLPYETKQCCGSSEELDQELALTSSMPAPSFCEQSMGKAKPHGYQLFHATSPQDHKMPLLILLIQIILKSHLSAQEDMADIQIRKAWSFSYRNGNSVRACQRKKQMFSVPQNLEILDSYSPLNQTKQTT